MDTNMQKIIASDPSKTRVALNMSILSIRRNIPQLRNLSDWFIFTGMRHLQGLMGSLLLRFVQKTTPGLSVDSIRRGLQRLVDLVDAGVEVSCDFYTDEEKSEQPDRAGTKLIYMPAVPGAPFAVICAGGAYKSVYSVVEGFPVAAALNGLGYNAFVLSYRAGGQGLLPKPMDDLAAAIRYILDNAGKFEVSPDNYCVAGFSAGGHIAASLGTCNNGYMRYALPKPGLLALGYTPSDLDTMDVGTKNKVSGFLFKTMFGKSYTHEDVNNSNIVKNLNDTCPPVYLWHCEDDPTVSIESARSMNRRLEELNIPHVFHSFHQGGHGIGTGQDTDAEVWIGEMVEFWRSVGNTQGGS